ncbi:hypothetical protein O181_074857 [Austropuccinia psidii MF-1]|uniref:Copia protein n=1 Tax=Austropuccinia psidii MF-1 TaxID=1389203 RepID=A0A9Q3FDU3_9BASI|nr:hypothetical protein [Austropuccinia psidii MF-1]
MWLKQWCHECDLLQLDNPIPVHEDNQSCINVVKGNCNLNNKRMKHVNIQLHFIKEAVKNNMINLIYTPTADMLADFLTNPVVLYKYCLKASCYLPSSLNSLTDLQSRLLHSD